MKTTAVIPVALLLVLLVTCGPHVQARQLHQLQDVELGSRTFFNDGDGAEPVDFKSFHPLNTITDMEATAHMARAETLLDVEMSGGLP